MKKFVKSLNEILAFTISFRVSVVSKSVLQNIYKPKVLSFKDEFI